LVELRGLDDGITARFTDGTTESFDLLVGADGANSLVREFVAPGRHPTYAGYPAWRGIVDESAVDASPLEGTIHGVFLDHALAVFYLVPGRGGELRGGRRGLNWLVYDGNEGPFSPEVHDVASATKGTVRSIPPGGLSPAQVDYIHHDIASALPCWHRDAIFATEEPYAQALYDLSLESYVRGRVCLIGDAATVARPHTGSGATKAIQDAVALGRALGAHPSVEVALRTFDDERRAVGNSLVQLGKQLGAQLVTEVPRWQELDRTSFAEWMDRSASRSTYMLRKPTK
jgi:2-polyprenyl-6-methoxyphenol hydroxylase-like FAD-dependent oxidoreductase